jgi:type IV pilus assembly protein PilV
MKLSGQSFKNEGKGGFSLLELLVAMLILTVGLLGTASLVVGITNGNVVSKEMTTATTLAQDKIEDMRRRTYPGIPSTNTTTTEAYGSVPGFPSFKRVTQTEVGIPAANMKLVTVTVLWKNDTRSTFSKTIISR